MNELIEKIHGFFKRIDWDYEYDEDTSTWYTAFRAKTGNIPIFVELSKNFIHFTISPVVNAPVDPVCRQRLHSYLLRLNYGITMAKFSLNDEEDVELSVELPLENLEYSDFHDGINALTHFTDMFHLEVLNMAQDPEYEPKTEEIWLSVMQGNDNEVN